MFIYLFILLESCWQACQECVQRALTTKRVKKKILCEPKFWKSVSKFGRKSLSFIMEKLGRVSENSLPHAQSFLVKVFNMKINYTLHQLLAGFAAEESQIE